MVSSCCFIIAISHSRSCMAMIFLGKKEALNHGTASYSICQDTFLFYLSCWFVPVWGWTPLGTAGGTWSSGPVLPWEPCSHWDWTACPSLHQSWGRCAADCRRAHCPAESTPTHSTAEDMEENVRDITFFFLFWKVTVNTF